MAEYMQEPIFESILSNSFLEQKCRNPLLLNIASDMAENGFAIVRGLIHDDLIAQVIEETFIELSDGIRKQDLWKKYDGPRQLATFDAITSILSELYGRRPIPFQTLNFRNGTEQKAHSDSVHFASIPPRFMCGVWVALEDVDESNGPLFYYPGSHRLPDATLQRFGLPVGTENYEVYADRQSAYLREGGFERFEFYAKAGDVLIWASNLVHGGSAIKDQRRSRLSQVTHYYFEDCIYVTPVMSIPELGEWVVRDSIVDIATDTTVPLSYSGNPVRIVPIGNGRSFLQLLSTEESDGATEESDGMQETIFSLQEQLEAIQRSRSYRASRLISSQVQRIRNLTAKNPRQSHSD
jgi:hypothetical protein